MDFDDFIVSYSYQTTSQVAGLDSLFYQATSSIKQCKRPLSVA